MNQRKKYNLILLIIIPILALCLLGMVASIYQNITAADDVFTINGSNSNYTTTGGNTITVTRTVNKRNLPSCDIIYWNENGATVIKNVDCSSGQATQNVTYIKAIVVPHYDYNVFVTSEYELRTLNNDWLYNENNGGIVDKKGENDLVIRSGFANVYVLQDITLSNDLTLNFPFYMDLLNARITGNVTVEHNYAGDFRIDGTFGGAITNLASLVSKGTLYYKETKQEYDNFSVFTAALDYIDDRIPDYILSNVNFPLSYSTYPAYYSYEITGNGIDRNGDVTRAADSQTVTVKVTVSYNGETGTRELQKTVVGTSPAAEGTYFQTMLAQELKDAYGIGADTPPAQLTNEQPLDLSVLLAELNTATVNTITVTGDSFEWNAETKYLTLKPHLAAGTLTVSCGGETGTYAVPRSSDETIVNFLDEQFPVPYFKEYDDADGNRVRVEEVRLFANEVTNKALTLADQTTCKYADDISFSYAFESDGTAVNIDDLAFLSWEENGVLKMDASSYKGEKVYVTLEVTIGAETYNIQREIILSVSNGFGGNETSFQNANLNPFGGEALGSFTHTIPDMYIAVELLNDSLGDAIQITTDKTDAYVQTVTISWRTNGNTYPFLIIDNGQRNGNFVPAGYSVTIKIENVPDFDVLLSLRVKMYNSAVNKISNTVQTSRDVYLTIPGILYYNTGNAGVAPREFKDAEFYGEIVKTTQNVPETDGACLSDAGYGVFRFTEEGNAKYVLLASGAGNAVEQLVYQNASAPATDITGIHYLTGTKSFNFANTELNSLEPFSRFTLTDNAVETLTLTNCGITDAKIWNGDVSYLYALNRLQMVDLSNNAIQTVAKGRNTVVYRTVTNMNLSDNQITELAGVENILKLQTLDISNNRINSFNDLKYCSALKSVYLYGNTSAVTGANGYYGTAGSVNLPVYVLLHDLGVTVYRENGDSPLTFGEGGDITTAQQNLARALNAIAYAKTQRNESLYFANSVTNTDISYTVTPVTVLQINGNTATPYAVTTGNTNTVSFTGAKPNNGTIYLIASITENGTTVYAQYEMTYQGGA